LPSPSRRATKAGLGGRVQRGVGKQLVGQRLDAGLAGDLPLVRRLGL
jgi:hypothetical protein